MWWWKLMEKTPNPLVAKIQFNGIRASDAYRLDYYLNIIRNINSVKLPNIISIYRRKLLEFAKFFEENGLSFFSSDCYLRVIIMIYLDNIMDKCFVDYNRYINILYKFHYFRFFRDLALKILKHSIYVKVDNIRSLQIGDLTSLLDASIDNKLLLSPLLPDTCFSFLNECIAELKALDFDIDDAYLEHIYKACSSLEIISNRLIELQGLEKRVERFNDFISRMKIDLSSTLVDKTNNKNQYRL